MMCQMAREWIPQLLDDELDPARRSELERHLQSCVNCAEAFDRAARLREKIRGDAPYFTAPEGLEARVRGALRKENPRRVQITPPLWWSIAAGIAAVFLVWVLLLNRSDRPVRDEIASEVVSTHIRALLPGHLIDVPSSDQHTVKPWFAGKLDFSPRVEDLAAKGFELKGGRLDYLHGRTVAALVFQRRQHVIDLFVAPRDEMSREADRARFAIHGYNIVHWTDPTGMSYWAVSDLNAEELAALQTAYQNGQ
jgi:anti-sigma factor RsiW